MKKIIITVTIIDEYPYFKLIVSHPGGKTTSDKAVWHIAASQFEPRLKEAFNQAVAELTLPYKQERK